MPDDPQESPDESRNADRGDSEDDPTPISAQEAARLLAEDGDITGREPDAAQSVFLSMLQRAAKLGKKPLALWKRFMLGALFLKRIEAARKDVRELRRQEILKQAASHALQIHLSTKKVDADLADRTLWVILDLPRQGLEMFLLVEWADCSLKEACKIVYGDWSERSLQEGNRRLISARRRVAGEIAKWTPEERADALSEASRGRIRSVLGDISGFMGEKK